MSNAPGKKYLEIETYLRERIRRGEYAGGRPIESESELGAQFGASRATVRHALERLQAAQLIERGQGRRSIAAGASLRYQARRFGRVGVISYAMQGYMFDGLKEGVCGGLAARGFEPVVRLTAEAAASERIALEDLMREPLDGLVIEGICTGLPCVNLDLYRRIEAQRLPIVFTDGHHSSVHAARVVGNDREIMCAMVDHLVSLGHARIGGLFSLTQIQGHHRFQGYLDGLRKHGLQYDDSRMLFLPFGDRRFIFDNLFNAYSEGIMASTAMVCFNDILARFLEMTLIRNGIAVPRQISVTGLDNADDAERVGVRLTSATHPRQRMGDAAAEMIVQMIESRQHVENRVLPYEFVRGDSTGIAPDPSRRK